MGQRSGKQAVSDMAGHPLRVAVTIPSVSGMWPASFGECLASMVQHFQNSEYEGIHEIRVFAKNGIIAPEIKHRLIGEALAWEATHILFLAPELIFPKDTLHRMLARPNPVVAVNYLRSSGKFAAYRGNSDVKPDPVLPETEEVDGVAMGMVMFTAPVFDVLELPFFEHVRIGETPGFCEDHIPFWKQCREKEIPCVIDHVLSQDIRSLHFERWH